MPQVQLTLLAAQDRVEPLSDALLEAGALAVSVDDVDEGSDSEQPLYGEPGLEPRAIGWARSRLLVLFDDDRSADAALALLVAAHALEAADVTARATVQGQDWVRLTQAQFEPIVVSPRLSIVPSWHDAPPTELTIALDPGVAFGTGSHPTTHLCLQWLCEHAPQALSVLDYGCGSGILAIAAAKLGARAVLAVDIDPNAVQATQDNAARNAVTLEAALPQASQGRRFDVVLANILSSPLKVLAPLLAAQVQPGGMLVLSGILERQADELIAHYAPHAALSLWRAREGWVCLAGPVHHGR
ncbi:MAG: 50S ribosomal protein L11 methyltransferase [Betaproteobacteria bacterium]|nr:50S ribosomal protein L11 methyltransferase [Betaproteobacteria bacterium]MDE2048692.1 50S ribosomal protein L11 methyltransferase [Betaproteobacteria bacterium]